MSGVPGINRQLNIPTTINAAGQARDAAAPQAGVVVAKCNRDDPDPGQPFGDHAPQVARAHEHEIRGRSPFFRQGVRIEFPRRVQDVVQFLDDGMRFHYAVFICERNTRLTRSISASVRS